MSPIDALQDELETLRARVERLQRRVSREWFRGHSDAIAHVYASGEDTIARELLHAAGVCTMAEARRAGADEDVARRLRPLLLELRRRRDSRGRPR